MNLTSVEILKIIERKPYKIGRSKKSSFFCRSWDILYDDTAIVTVTDHELATRMVGIANGAYCEGRLSLVMEQELKFKEQELKKIKDNNEKH